MTKFEPLKESQIPDLINSMAKKSCALDPVPSHLLISSLNVLLPVITKIVNLSISEPVKNGQPSTQETEPGTTFQNLRPISNLSFISILTERAVAYIKSKGT